MELAQPSARNTKTPSLSLYYNMLLDPASFRRRMMFKLILIPVLVTLVMAILGMDEDWGESYILPELFLGINAMVVIGSMYMQSDMLPRSKLLWLRHGSSRHDMWRFIEKNIFKEFIAIYLLCGAIALIFFLFGEITSTQAASYLIVIIGLSQFYTYFPLYCSITPGLRLSILWLVGTLVSVITIVFNSGINISHDSYPKLIPVSAGMLILGLYFRFEARKSYLKIDWLKVKPKLIKNKALALTG